MLLRVPRARRNARVMSSSSAHSSSAPYHTPDTVEGELGMLVTISSLVLAMAFIPISSISRDEAALASDQDKPGVPYPWIVGSIFWFAVLCGALSTTLSVFIYIAWRARRPHPADHEKANRFYAHFSTELNAVYVVIVVEVFVLAVASLWLVFVKTADAGSQSIATFSGVAWMAIIALLMLRLFSRYRTWVTSCEPLGAEGESDAGESPASPSSAPDRQVTVVNVAGDVGKGYPVSPYSP